MRNSIVLYINGKRHELRSEQAFMTTAEYLRYVKGLTGTKIVCAEGDCGACTILVSRMVNKKLTPYKSLNSCISFMYLLDRSHLITVEGLKKNNELHPVQKAMVKNQGAQCGYCTPGFICAMAALTEDAKHKKITLDEKKVKNYLTGNLCRCTGYDSIIKSGCSVDLSEVSFLTDFYNDIDIEKDLAELSGHVTIREGKHEVLLPESMDEALKHKSSNHHLKMTSGATDLGVLSNKGKIKLNSVMSLINIPSLYEIHENSHFIAIGARVSLDQLEKATLKSFPAFSKSLHLFASPQIKNAGTLIGNLVNASPIGDTIAFLRVAEAEVVLESVRGGRVLNVNQFFKGGYKELDLKTDEIVTYIKIPKTDHEYKLYKVSTRKDLDISTVAMAIRYKLKENILEDFSLALGGVGPVALRMDAIEQKAKGELFTQALFKDLAMELKSLIKPLNDVRGSSDYRLLLCHNLLLKFCDQVMQEKNLSFQEISL